MTALWLRLLALLAALGTGDPAAPRAAPLAERPGEEAFPHERHARVFPLCDGCHGRFTATDSAVYPDAASCTRCHDGARKPRVSWTGPARAASNLRFSHAAHQRASERAGRAAECAACHQAGGSGPMAVTPLRAATCFGCHAGAEHLDAATDCAKCHSPLAAVTSWDTARIAALPRPAAHANPAFLREHGTAASAPAASCATCHARESCQRCHPNGGRVAAITALAPDARVAAITRALTPRYDAPESHVRGWEWSHGPAAAAGVAGCANCHTQSSCSACHGSGNPVVTGALPAGGGRDGPGVRYATPRRVHARGFERGHQAAGASDASCLGCHERSSCDQCHATRRTGGFHEPNYTEQHGPAAYGNDLQCGSCHNTERFCRGCHAGTGRAGTGRNDVAFHTATPLWLIGHGQAARQSLEGCASCHAQADCTRCHSSLAGWGVSPHGTGFNASRLAQQSRLTCLRCHRASELGGR